MKILANGLMGLMVVLLSVIGFIYYTEGAEAFSLKTVEVHEEQVMDGASINSLKIDTGSVDVKLVPSASDDIKVELAGEVSEKMEDAFTLTVAEKNGDLHVQLKREKQPAFTVFAINKHTQLTISVPEKMYDQVAMETTSGDLTIGEITSHDIELAAKSGDIFANKLEGEGGLSIKSTSGDIKAAEFSFKESALQSTSGDIFAEQAEAITILSVATTSGDVVVAPVAEAYSLDVQTNSGDGEFNVSGLLFQEKTEERVIGKKGNGGLSVEITTTSGDYQLN